MLVVTLVATLASAALWQQWRSVEVEAAERSRSQLAWVLTGALDWARLILREDARSSQADHLSEPWALPLQEARLSSFLALDKDNTDDAQDAFLSGQISDAQARLNVLNLVEAGKLSEPAYRAFSKLFKRLGLPPTQLDVLADNLLRVSGPASTSGGAIPLSPQRQDQLLWLGLSATTLAVLQPHITLLPQRTPVNLNTASAQVIYASIPKLDMTQAQRFVTQRASTHFSTLASALKSLEVSIDPSDASQLSVASNYFEVRGRLRLGPTAVQERSLIERRGLETLILWREREVLSPPVAGQAAASLQ